MRFLFHVGMGKTGSTAIQHALAQSGEELAAARLRYAGMWAPWRGSQHNGAVEFQRFLALPAEQLVLEADRCLAWAERIGAETGAQGLVHSNEAFHALPFFRRLAEQAEVRLLAYVRAPARWLPSAYMQWGIVHKTNTGPVATFAATGRRLMAQYRAIRALDEGMGGLLEVRAYPEGGDVIEDFGEVIGVRLSQPAGRPQARPSPVEAMFRAAFNGAVREPVLPRSFNEALPALRGPGRPAPASARARELFDLSALPGILAENGELLAWFRDRHGLDLAAEPPAPREDLGVDLTGDPGSADWGGLADGLLGALVEVAAAQGREIAQLRARLEALEASGALAAGQEAS